MSFQRARSNSQIKDRIEEIISVASDLYNTVGYEGLNFSAISELTNFTRPAIYKYFSTKEEILIKILSRDIELWVKHLVSSFQSNKKYTVTDISNIWAHSLSKQERMNELHAILFTILEKNSSKETLIEFKKSLFSSAIPLHDLLCRLFPNASYAQISNFMTIQYALAVGLYPMCNLSVNQTEAMKIVSPNYVSPSFEKGYQKAIYQIMLGLEYEDTPKP